MPAITTFRNTEGAGKARSYGPLPAQRAMRGLSYKPPFPREMTSFRQCVEPESTSRPDTNRLNAG